MLDAAIAASTVSTLGVGINGPGQNPGIRNSPPGTTAAGAQSGFAASGQTFSTAITAALSTAATTFLQAPAISQAPVDGQSTDNDPTRERQSPFAERVEAIASGKQEDSRTGGDGDASDTSEDNTSNRSQAEDARAARETIRSANEEGPDGLTDPERQQVRELQRTDAEVRRHEQAHAAVGGPYAGAPRYQFATGPDGKQYAVSGQVSIDASSIPGNPQATIQKLRIVQRAALAPSEPSGQDRQVAATAQRGIIEARQQLAQERAEERAEAAAESGQEVIGENVGPIRSEALASPVTDAPTSALRTNENGVSAASASQAFLQASALTFQRPPEQTVNVSPGGLTGPVIDTGALFDLTA